MEAFCPVGALEAQRAEPHDGCVLGAGLAVPRWSLENLQEPTASGSASSSQPSVAGQYVE